MYIFSGYTKSIDSTMTQTATKHALLHPSVTKDTSFRWTSVHFEAYLGNGCKVGKDQREHQRLHCCIANKTRGMNSHLLQFGRDHLAVYDSRNIARI